MGNVFCICTRIGSLKKRPVFYLRADEDIIKDVSGNYEIINHGASVSNNVIYLKGGLIATNTISLLKSLWGRRDFSIQIKIVFHGFIKGRGHYIFGNNFNPLSISIDTKKAIYISTANVYGEHIISRMKLSVNAEYIISVVVKDNILHLYINDHLQGKRGIGSELDERHPFCIGGFKSGTQLFPSAADASLHYLKIFDYAVK